MRQDILLSMASQLIAVSALCVSKRRSSANTRSLASSVHQTLAGFAALRYWAALLFCNKRASIIKPRND